MPTFEKQDPDVVARALKFGVFVKKHPSHAAPVVARAQTLSLKHRRRPSAALKFGVFVKRHPSHAAPVVARAQALPPRRRRRHPSGYAFAWAPTAVVARRCLRAIAGIVARAGLICARTSQGIKGPAFLSLLTLLPSKACWVGPAL